MKIDAAFATKAAPLAERPRAAEAPSLSPSGKAYPAAADRTKFDGVFTVSLEWPIRSPGIEPCSSGSGISPGYRFAVSGLR